MRVVLQRVKRAAVNINNNINKEKIAINKGLLLFVGIKKGEGDDKEIDNKIDYLADKIINLRIFEDEQNKMNLSVANINGEVLVVPQFTLYGDCKRGRRPSFDNVEEKTKAKRLYEKFIAAIENKLKNNKLKTGKFQEYMEVEIINDGPCTFILEV